MAKQPNFERLIKIPDEDDDDSAGDTEVDNDKKLFLSTKNKSNPSDNSCTSQSLDFTINGTHVHINDKHLKYISLSTLTIQNAALNLTMRAARTQKEQFSAPVAVTIAELLKLVTCILVVMFQKRSVIAGLKTFQNDVLINYTDTLRVAVPALVYYIQNNLLYIGITHLDAATAQVTYQLKILTTAIFSVLMLKKKLSKIQWTSLVTLFIGVAFIEALAVQGEHHQSPEHGSDIEPKADRFEYEDANKLKTESPAIGLLAMLVACCLSGFAGVYFEKILKKTNAVSLWVRNIQLALATLPFGLLQVVLVHDGPVQNKYFHGFTPLTWFCIFLQVQGGLLVAVVVKYANNISKGFATSLSIVIATLASIFLFNFSLRQEFVFGSSLVILSVMMYNKQ